MTPPIVDCNVQVVIDDPRILTPYLSAHWRQHLETFGVRGPGGVTPTRPSADLASLREKLLDGRGIELGMLVPLAPVGQQNNLDLDAALARAANDWQIAEWVELEARLRASILVSYEDPAAAVDEIEHRAGDRRFVHVQVMGRTRAPMGSQRYWPIYAAAERHGLPVVSPASGGSGYPISGGGWPSFELEERVGRSQAMQANVISLVCEGVFERFKGLRVVSAGNGTAWMPPLMWRLDGTWKLLKDEVPELTRPPSEYARDNLYFCAQPAEMAQLAQVVEHLGFDDRMVFGSGSAAGDAFELPGKLAGKVLSSNARTMYGERL